MRWFSWVLVLMIVLSAGVARAGTGAESVTLPSGEVVTIGATGGEITVTLANGVSATRKYTESGAYWAAGIGASSEDMIKIEQAYELWAGSTPPARERSGNPLVGILLLLFGSLNAAFPRVAWYLKDGWKFQDAEPSDEALMLYRVGGGLAAVVGLVVMFI